MKRVRHRAKAVVAAALAVAAAGCSGAGAPAGNQSAPTTVAPLGTGTPSTTAPAPPLTWSSCKGAAGPKGFQCATLMVPRDPVHPGRGGMIAMAVDRRPATGHKIGSLVYDPGGPGVSGVDGLPGIVTGMPKDLLARFDVVGFDPPGVGRTAPITCLDSAGLTQYFAADPAPTTAAGVAAFVAEARAFAQGCQARSGAELPYVSTVDAAMDMDRLRQALGDAKLTYLGFSYGTLLGDTYAQLYPTRIRAMVLDGTLDPSVPVLAQLDAQAAGLESVLHQFIATCASDSKCPWKEGANPEGSIESLMASVRSSPLPAQGTSRTAGPAAVFYGIVWPLYFQSTWPDLETVLALAERGDGTGLLDEFDQYTGRQSDGSYGNLFEALAAVDCLDQPAPTLAQIQAAIPEAERASPVFGLATLYGEVGCTVWPLKATGKVGPIHAPGSPPILVVGSTGDPITPYVWAQSVASQLQHGVLLTRVGFGHTAYFASRCVQSDVDSYLITLAPPGPGTRCQTDS